MIRSGPCVRRCRASILRWMIAASPTNSRSDTSLECGPLATAPATEGHHPSAEPSSAQAHARQEPKVCGLPAGEKWIRTLAGNQTLGKLRLSGPRHRRNSTPNQDKIVSKKDDQGRRGSASIPSLARDTAPFICWGNWVSLLNAAGLSEITIADTATLCWAEGVWDIKIHGNTVPPIRSVILQQCNTPF